MLNSLTVSQLDCIKDDPIRPHIDATWRINDGREVYSLTEDQYAEFDEVLHEGPISIICVSYCNEIPASEEDLITYNDSTGKIAVFYTVWSYVKGAGRTIVLDTASYIKRTKPDVERFITLSPKTDMARTFHLRNGASELRENDKSINYEYPTEVIK
jgi:hypothetical protein|tara:strand:+ start:2185 stop:2655 length:471 start_codon:yes stop_codon:yes gene_type:complete